MQCCKAIKRKQATLGFQRVSKRGLPGQWSGIGYLRCKPLSSAGGSRSGSSLTSLSVSVSSRTVSEISENTWSASKFLNLNNQPGVQTNWMPKFERLGNTHRKDQQPEPLLHLLSLWQHPVNSAQSKIKVKVENAPRKVENKVMI